MKIRELKQAVLSNYQNNKERKLSDYWTNEIKEGFDILLNYQEGVQIDDDIIKEIKGKEDEILELADSSVDVYTSELLKWYQEDLNRIYYANEFLSEFGESKDIFQILSGGQSKYYQELLGYVLNLIKEELEILNLEAEEIIEGTDTLEEKAEKLEKI